MRGIERSGERVRKATDETVQMGKEINGRSAEVREAAQNLAEIITRSMQSDGRRRRAGG